MVNTLIMEIKMDKKVFLLLLIIVSLNIFDCFATLWGISNQYITELNPLNKILLENNSNYFLLFKFLTTLLLIIAYVIPSKEAYYLRFYGGIILSFSLGAVFILHLQWIYVIFL